MYGHPEIKQKVLQFFLLKFFVLSLPQKIPMIEYHEYQCRLPIWLLKEADKAEDYFLNNNMKTIKIPKKALVAAIWEELSWRPYVHEDEVKNRLIRTCERVQSKLDGNKSVYALDDEKYTPPTKIMLPKEILDSVGNLAAKNYKTMTKPKPWMLCLIICNYAKEIADMLEIDVAHIIIEATEHINKRRHKIIYENE